MRATRAAAARRAAVVQKPVQLAATPPSALPPMPSKAVLITLDSPSLQARPNPAFPVMLPVGAVAKRLDPKTSRMPSPIPGPIARLFRIVVDAIWLDELSERVTPVPMLPVMIASRMVTEEPKKAKTPPGEAGLPFPEIVFPPMMSALALARLIPILRAAGSALVPLPVIWFIAMRAPEPNTMWMPFEALALITLPAALLALSTPMRAEPLVN